MAAISITHPFVSTKGASSDPTKVDGPKWNAAHTINVAALCVVGNPSNNGGQPAEEIVAGTDGYILRRNGTTLGFGTLSKPIFEDGTVAAPSIGFVNDTDSGFYRPAANTIALALAGALALTAALASTGLTFSSPTRGFWVDDGTGVNLWRLSDRVFVGEAAANATGNGVVGTPSQGSIIPTSAEGANWALRDSQFMCIAETGLIAITGISRSSDQNSLPTECIGVAGYVINNKASGDAWALYGDVQHESGVDDSFGLELAVKNKGANVGASAYDAPTSAAVGIHINSGDNSYGGSGANPTAVAMQVSAGSSQGYNTGIVFYSGSLAVSPTTGFRTAMSLAQAHRIQWGVSAGVTGFTLHSDIAAGADRLAMIADTTGLHVANASDIDIFRVAKVTGAVDGSLVVVASTVATPALTAEGSAADIHVFLNPKGSGNVVCDQATIPGADNTYALGNAGTNRWSDLFLGDGAVINFNNGDAALTHSTNKLAFTGAASGYTFNDGNIIAGHTASIGGGPGAAEARIQVHGTDGPGASFANVRWSNTATGPSNYLSKSRAGTIGTHTIVQNGDTLGIFQFAGSDGAAFILAATISAVVGGTPGTNDMPGALVFSTTADGATSSTERFRVNAAGQCLAVFPTGGLGYGTGAGGTVTQATSRTTGVTLNTVTGSITLVSAAGSATYATFTVTNSAVAAADTPIVVQRSGTDDYEIHVTAVAAGSFDITFRTTGGTTTEQPVFSFALIKGVTS